MTASSGTRTTQDVGLRSIQIMARGARADFDQVVAPGAVNRESASEPPACRGGGPAAFHATALWLRTAFADLEHRVEHVVAQDDLVVVDTTMSGRHTGRSSCTLRTARSSGPGLPPGGPSRCGRRTGFGSPEGWSASTGPSATTSD